MKNLLWQMRKLLPMKLLNGVLIAGALLFSSTVSAQASIGLPAPAVYFNLNGDRFLDGDSACKSQEHSSYFATFFNGRIGVNPLFGVGCFFDTLNWATGELGTEPAFFQNWVHEYGVCPLGYEPNGLGTVGHPCTCTNQRLCPTQPRAGPATCRPVCIGTGNKYFSDTDIDLPGGKFRFTREYNSQSTGTALRGTFGDSRWRTVFDSKLQVTEVPANSATVVAQRPDGQSWIFRKQATGWLADLAKTETLQEIFDANGLRTGWRLTTDSSVVESYSKAGLLTGMTWPDGYQVTFTFGDKGLVTAIGDSYGRALTFEYDAGSRLTKMTDMSGASTLYAYDYYQAGSYHYLLKSVTYPDGKTKNYLYENGACRNAVTGITDENGTRYLMVTYSADGNCRVIAEETSGGTNKFTFDYSVPNVTQVVDPLGATRNYSKSIVQWVDRSVAVSQPCPGCAQANTYDVNGNLASRIDWNNNKTCYAYDLARNLETRRVEGLPSAANCASYLTGTPSLTAPARMTSTVWSTDWRLPTQVAEPLRITTYTYGSPTASNPGDRGNILTRTVQATTDATGAQGLAATPTGSPRIANITYNANGSVLTSDGPRTDVADITEYSYYPNNDPDFGKRGNVATVKNALAHTTTITKYNAHGQPTEITDPNGLATTLTYDSRLRLTARKVGSETTTYTYDGVGQLTQVTLPDNSSITYTYDGAHRLTAMADSQGNRIAYTLDLMGNRIKEETFDPANQLAQKRSRVYNALNRLTQDIGAQNQTTQYAYDNQGNLTQVTDPLNRITSNSYDALNRLSAMTQPAVALPGGGSASPVIAYGYNGQDQLTQVTDPRNLVTSYAYDGLGNLNQQVSPDTGMTANSYDAAGNITTSTDAKGQTTAYAYDALNRVTSLTYNQATANQLKTVTYQYDQSNAQSTNGVGRLTTVTETASNATVLQTTQYSYDVKGRLTQETRTLAGNVNPYITTYTYDQSNGRMTAMTYPSGRTLAYSYDTVGRINQISTTNPANATVNPGQTQLLATNIQYHPFGGVKSYTLGNNQTVTRSYDQDGRISSYTLGGNSTSIGYDPASRIVSLLDTANAANSNSYGYDNLDRLIQTVLPNTSYSYQYDLTGNRTAKGAGANNDSYTIAPTSNRIAQIAGADTKVFSYDPNGSTLNDGNNSYGYDIRGRMVQATSSFGTTTYQVNAMGQRVRKTNPSATIGDTVFHYDAQGKLIAETTPAGTLKKEYLYLLDLPVAVSVQ